MNCTVLLRLPAASFLALLLFGCATPEPYDQVAAGESRQQVIGLLGDPNVPDRDYTSNERHAVQGAVSEMHINGAESFSTWRRGELFYVVGFDSKGTVAVKRKFFYLAP